MKKHLQDSLVIGFALFSMFFGAGNVIFPPYLGLESGPDWLLGFFSYYVADIGDVYKRQASHRASSAIPCSRSPRPGPTSSTAVTWA